MILNQYKYLIINLKMKCMNQRILHLMKTTLMLSMFLLLNLTVFGQAKTANLPVLSSAITIDGNGSDWSGVSAITADTITHGKENWTGVNDFSASFKTVWDKKNLYILADIKDDVKVKDGTFYLVDNLELWLDVNHSKGAAMDGVDDIKMRINRDSVWVASCPTCNEFGTFPWAAGLGMKGMVAKQTETATGWMVELSIPWDSIQSMNPTPVSIADGLEIGFNAYFCDQDDVAAGGATRTKLFWSPIGTGNPVDFGTLKLTGTPAEAFCMAVTQPLTIDGDAADWVSIPEVQITNVSYGKENLTGANDFSGSFKTAWDNKNLYFHADITDDVKIKNGTFYLVDNLELWLDVNHSKGAAMDGVDDIKLRINRDSVWVASCPTCNELGTFPWAAGLGMKGMVAKQTETAKGWMVELSIPWDSIQSKNPTPVTIASGLEIGFNAYFCDQDDAAAGGATRTKLHFVGPGTSNPVDFATMKLAGTPMAAYIQAVQGPIAVDGNSSDWSAINAVEITNVSYGKENLTAANDFSGSFKTAWDNKNLYFLADITDDVKIKNGTFYLVDNLELWLDVNHSKGAAMDGVDDIKLRINRDSVWVASCPTCNELGTFPWAAGLGMKGMVAKQTETAKGWMVELSIPWDSIQSKNPTPVTIADGLEIGFNAYFCDQDDAAAGGATRTKLHFVGPGTSNPVDFATVKLTGTPAVIDEYAYKQRFINLTGANVDMSTVGWKGYTNVQSTEIISTSGFQGGLSGGVGTVVSNDNNDKGYIFMYSGDAVRLLTMSNIRITRTPVEINEIGFIMRDHSNGFKYTAQVAVQIAGQWYVNEEVFNVNTPAPATTTFTPRTFTWKTTAWKKLIFDQADPTKLAISSEPAGNLPAGNLDNFGFYSTNPGGGSAVIDEVYVKGGINGGAYDNVPPPVPVLTAKAAETTAKISLTWNAVQDNLGTVSYNIYNNLKLFVGSTTSTSYEVSNLEWETEYTYYIKSKDSNGNESDYSKAAFAKTVAKPTSDLVPPSNPVVTASAVKNWVNLKWTASTDNFEVTGYKVYAAATGSQLIATVPATQLSYMVDRLNGVDLTANTAYTFYVAAFDAAGNESQRMAGTATTGTAGAIYKAAYGTTTLKIDGVADEAIWKSAAKAPISIIHQGKIADKNDCDGFFQVVFDNSNLYLYVEIIDEAQFAWDGISAWPNDKYMFDAVEVFFSLSNAYDHAPLKGGDSQLRFNYDILDQITGQWGLANGTQVELGPKSPKKDSELGMTHAQSFNLTNSGWTLEVKMPLKNLGAEMGGFTTNPGKRIGFDVNILDNDGTLETNGNVIREAVLSWGNATGKDTWNNTAYLATVEFVGGPSTFASTTEKLKFQLYPNPVNEVLNIVADDIAKVEIYNILGAKVYSEAGRMLNKMTVQMAGMKPGIYMVKVYNSKGDYDSQKIVKQ